MNRSNDLKNILNTPKKDITNNEKDNNITDDYCSNIMRILDNQQNKNKAWSKLDKNTKSILLNEYLEKFKINNSLNDEEFKQLHNILIKGLHNNLLNKQSDVIYNKDTEEIEIINSLVFNTEKNIYEIISKDKGTRVTNKTKTNINRLINSKRSKSN